MNKSKSVQLPLGTIIWQYDVVINDEDAVVSYYFHLYMDCLCLSICSICRGDMARSAFFF